MASLRKHPPLNFDQQIASTHGHLLSTMCSIAPSMQDSDTEFVDGLLRPFVPTRRRTRDADATDEGRLQLLQATHPLAIPSVNEPFRWEIDDVMALMKMNSVVTSNPFYQCGYMMCLTAHLNGFGLGKNTHLSLLLSLMRGKYDDLLRWPFIHPISIALLHQQDLSRHHSLTLTPLPDHPSYQRPISDMNEAIPCPTFAPLSLIREKNYVHSDSLLLQCSA